MTRDELVEVITKTLVGDDMDADHLAFCRNMGVDVLKAIEAQGLAIVERRLVRAVSYVAAENLPRPTDGTATSMLLYEQKVDEINALLKQAIPI